MEASICQPSGLYEVGWNKMVIVCLIIELNIFLFVPNAQFTHLL